MIYLLFILYKIILDKADNLTLLFITVDDQAIFPIGYLPCRVKCELFAFYH